MVVDYHLILSDERVDHDLEDVQQLARIAAAETEQRVGLDDTDPALLKYDVSAQCTIQQNLQVGGFKRLKHIHLAARQKGSDDFERRVLRGRAHEHYGTVLDCTQQGILLGFVEAVDLVDEEDGGERVREERAAARAVDDVADVLDSGAHRGKGIELPVESLRDDMGERGLSDTGRSPQDEGRERAALDHVPEDATGPYKVPLADIIVQRTGPHTLRKGREHGTEPYLVILLGHFR